jgi:hypothetical protein
MGVLGSVEVVVRDVDNMDEILPSQDSSADRAGVWLLRIVS